VPHFSVIRPPHFYSAAPTDRLLLRKVGGGYAFIHRMLLDHFAARYDERSGGGEMTPPGDPCC
jgi:hypothetical protein